MDELAYFELAEDPFRIGPDPRFLYLSEQVQVAMAKCEYLAQERIGPIYIYGPIGSGKTSILRRLNERLSQNERYNIALIISPNIKTSNAFLRLIMDSFGVKTERAYDQCLRNFQEFLLEQYRAQSIPVLLVDEAQNMNRDMLKLVHFLLNFETATTKLLQIILAGQEELATKVLRYRELASRMYPNAMNAMSIEELKKMVAYRWMISGGRLHASPFDDGSDEIFKVMFAYSKGLPRDAVKLCGETLRYLTATGKKHVSPDEIEILAKDLNLTNTL